MTGTGREDEGSAASGGNNAPDDDTGAGQESTETNDKNETNDNDRNDRLELRELLEKIAAQAGDPPEHGLEVVDAMRRRRGRHRRGAVATAVVLAAVTAVAAPWLARLDDGHDVTSVADAGGRLPAELPDVLQLACTPEGIDVPVASIRPQPDGLHVAIDNQLAQPTSVWVTSEGWSSGRVTVEPGASGLRQPVPPGSLTVGCRIDSRSEQRQVDLVDVDGYYQEPELSCPEAERRELPELRPVQPPTWSLVGATRLGLGDRLRADDDIEAPDGYPDEHLGDPTVDPTVRIVRDGNTVAFAHLAGEGTSPPGAGDGQAGATDAGPAVTTRPLGQPWSQVRMVVACASFLDGTGAPVASLSPTSAN